MFLGRFMAALILHCCGITFFFSATLEGLRFEIKPFERRVANKNIEGKQCTIAQYMNDNKMSH